MIDRIIYYIGLATIILIPIYFLLKLFLSKNWKYKLGFRMIAGENLTHSVKMLRKEIREKDIKEDTVVDVGLGVFKRFTRIGLFAVVGALIPILLIGLQAFLLWQQNEKINLQNNLIEADRRGSLILLMTNVLDQMNDEILVQREADQAHYDSVGYSLSDPLIGRIAALSQGFLPYKYLEGDTLTAREVSPERGQLLLALVKSNLDTMTYKKIYGASNFHSAYLRGANLRFAYLRSANLRSADLRYVDLRDATLSYADFRYADLRDADLRSADLRDADLRYADLRSANLRSAYLSYADLRDADLRDAYLNSAYLSYANLSYANLSDANLRSANLNSANLNSANLSDANLSDANLSDANLSDADLSDAYLSDANLSDADLSSADLRYAYLSSAYLNSADLSSADLSSANLSSANLSSANLSSANLSEIIGLTSIQLKPAWRLWKCKYLDDSIKRPLEAEMPCLFTWGGCEENIPEWLRN